VDAFPARLLQISTIADAERELRRIGVDPAGIARMASKMLFHCVHLSGLQCRQANILKQEMLALGGDAAVARGTVACSINSTDVVLIGTEKQLAALCDRLPAQPFGLSAVAIGLKGLLARSAALPVSWRTSLREIPLARPLIMGILNVTPDSFSDGNRFLDPARAIERAREMAAEGADIIDIGGESTRPGAEEVPADVEIGRVVPVIAALAGSLPCAISVDTWKSRVAAAAVAAGAEIINDISGLTFDTSMAEIVARSKSGVVLMHTRGTPGTMQTDTSYHDLLGEVMDQLQHSVKTAVDTGIERNRIAVDPGIGFAKDAGGNLELLKRLKEFTGLGLPLLVGTSRKSFIGRALGRDADDRLFGTAATVALAVANGASILRVHDVAAMRDVADMAHAIMTSRCGE